MDYYYHVEGYSGPPSWEIFWVFGKIVGGGCNSDASSSCCKDFGCSIDGDYSPGCVPQGKGDCTAPICKAKGYTCSPGHGECCGFDRARSDGRGLGCGWCRL